MKPNKSKLKNFVVASVLIIALFVSCKKEKSEEVAVQPKSDITVLFDGTNLDHWEVRDVGDAKFRIKDSTMYSDKFEKGDFIFTKKEYVNFHLKFEYQLPDDGNSGVIIRAGSERPYDWETGFEIQLVSPWTPPLDDFHCTGALYGYAAVQNRPTETPNQWHSMEIRCDRKVVTTIVDGNLTMTVDTDTIPKMEHMQLKGFVGFQPNHAEKEGKYVQFRNVSIKDLDLNPDYVAKGFYEEDERLRVLAHERAVALGTDVVDQLVVLLAEQNTMVKNGAKQVLFDIVVKATNPNTSVSEKNRVKDALNESLNTSVVPDYCKTYLEELIRIME
ncbi:DUF1080 domain-containing protein [Seonamhaeicola sp.]|uniref:3-keto-disaccharide hydrolase n=1 Tax=Seonamhaeicola sp. TaxID=1912245 RepID=UPI002623F4EC|nr:DUF1080 domain-containing protein [Seonamhaeicola sp.]